MDLEKLKFPIGKYNNNKNPDAELLKQWISEIEQFPTKINLLTKDLSIEQLNWQYRPDGWSIKQVVHHCSDSHMNALIRFKLALTEKETTIRPYFEDRWANLIDSQNDDISISIQMIYGIHAKWVQVLNNLKSEERNIELYHPEYKHHYNIAEYIGNYAWHCNHHYGHVGNAIEAKGKFNING